MFDAMTDSDINIQILKVMDKDGNDITAEVLSEGEPKPDNLPRHEVDDEWLKVYMNGKNDDHWLVRQNQEGDYTLYANNAQSRAYSGGGLPKRLSRDELMAKSKKLASVIDLIPSYQGETDSNLNADNSENSNATNRKVIKGKKSTVKTAKGTKIDTVFALMDAKYVIASHTLSGQENPKYDQTLQPRDRKRESSIAWIQKTAKDLDPDMLGKTRRADTGSPIIGEDNMVESGNGRTLAIKLAYQNGDAGDYLDWLKENADIFGFTEAQVNGYQEPILVRIRTTRLIERLCNGSQSRRQTSIHRHRTGKKRC